MMPPVPDWDTYFFEMCKVIATRSKDPATKLGVVIVRDNRVLTTGYNGFPAGVFEGLDRWERPTKYDFVVHAEANAILQAARNGVRIEGATLYTLLKPCKDCAKAIAASGIVEVKYDREYSESYDARSRDNPHGFSVANLILREAGVWVRAIGTNENEFDIETDIPF